MLTSISSFQGTSGGEGPTGTALSLVLYWGDISCTYPVDLSSIWCWSLWDEIINEIVVNKLLLFWHFETKETVVLFLSPIRELVVAINSCVLDLVHGLNLCVFLNEIHESHLEFSCVVIFLVKFDEIFHEVRLVGFFHGRSSSDKGEREVFH